MVRGERGAGVCSVRVVKGEAMNNWDYDARNGKPREWMWILLFIPLGVAVFWWLFR